VNRYDKDAWVRQLPTRNAATTLLAVDPVIHLGDDWTKIGWDFAGSTSHMLGLRPNGANELYTDGHATWVRFSNMKVQSTAAYEWYWKP